MLWRAPVRWTTPPRAARHQSTPNILSCFQLLMLSFRQMLPDMTLRAPQNPSKMTGREREELLESLLIDEPELTFTPRGDPDPRLLRLVDFLARQAARECYAEEVKTTRRRGKRIS
ncbi:hypothetical protein [Brucella pseudogrignonensis]|uniref:hypothetical protein n=1 Tax=Brucella pseudogrignonensis TaxID=419475 RepID=UPI003D9A06DB